MSDQTLAIKVRGLVTRFGPKTIHDHLDLDVHRGEILGVIARASPFFCVRSSA
jgi:phospholipid/cholesterol/gamma-HCH transport system ATP-binding protein